MTEHKRFAKSLKTEKKKDDKRGTNPKSLANLYKFPKGVSGNPGGRPKLLSDAYREWLALVDEKSGLTHAQLLAQGIGTRAIVTMDVQSAKEIRSATEGDTLRLATWQTEIIDALKKGALTAEQVVKEIGMDDARQLIIAAGQTIPASAPSTETSAPTNDTNKIE